MATPIVRSLTSARDAAQRIADGDLSGTIEVVGRDEFAALLAACGRMQDSLRAIVKELQDDAQNIAGMSEELSTTTQQIAAATDEQSQSASSAASVEQMSVSITHVSDRAGDVRKLAERTGQSTQDITSMVASVEEITSGLQEQSTASNDIARRVEQIAAASEENSTAASAQALEEVSVRLQQATARFRLA